MNFLWFALVQGVQHKSVLKSVKGTRIPKTKAGTTWWSVRLLHSWWTFAYKYTQCGRLDIENNPDSHWLGFVNELGSTSYLQGVAHFFNGCDSTPTMLSSPATSPVCPNVSPNQPPVHVPISPATTDSELRPIIPEPASATGLGATSLPVPPTANPPDNRCWGPNCIQRACLPCNCSTCSHFYCKTCCQKYQKLTGSRCKEPCHTCEPDVSSAATGTSGSTIDNGGSNAAGNSEFYDPTKPLAKEHYEAHEWVAQQWHQDTEMSLQVKELRGSIEKNLTIVFWKEVSWPQLWLIICAWA